ncbi:UBP-type zinc finger domain-containing protein [Sphingomonas faeni]|uniref:UBP-type zinc finger domain-containing protein n=1 Tax=Sphingomonas faeni TaxID=185950 RepID=UPI0020BEB6F6|nr:UBP-type zinc finger domain-containing protein [Sphingomonas faeni]MCK8455327.1 UBP-type zinc finger domain-containing protein [Sphingomonas faeni]
MDTIRSVTPSAKGCEECLRIGTEWVHLRLCRECGHVGCCDDSPHRHATAHFHATRHSIIEGYDPPEGWGWCFIYETMVDLPDQTAQWGPIPRFVERQTVRAGDGARGLSVRSSPARGRWRRRRRRGRIAKRAFPVPPPPSG